MKIEAVVKVTYEVEITDYCFSCKVKSRKQLILDLEKAALKHVLIENIDENAKVDIQIREIK